MLVSTRSNIKVSASKAILEGLASDGGLYIYDLDFFKNKINYEDLLNCSYKELCLHILTCLLDDYTEEELKVAIDKAYDSSFDEGIVNYKDLNGNLVLELFHGPTLAFKDMALSVLPSLLSQAKKKHNIKGDTIILTATSGDTGGASLSGFSKLDDMKLVVFYPNSGVSKLQEKQMLSFKNDNNRVISVEGNFDDTQNFVKKMFLSHKELSSSNSINIGRLVPQVVYYFDAYLEMVRENKIKMDEAINVCVPCGNFGNILAGYIAKKLGLPIDKLICASNKNKVLTDFFNTGVYDKNREFYKTNSPSMDILISSNLERLLYLNGLDCKDLMKKLNETGKYSLSKEELSRLKDFKAYTLDEVETLNTIKETYDKYNYLMDTHTAVAYGAYLKYAQDTKDLTKTVIVSTASPFKFADSILQIFDKTSDDPIDALAKTCNISIPRQILSYKTNSKVVWKKEDLDDNFNKLLKELKNE